MVDTWGEELVNAHDVAIARDGKAVYVAEMEPPAVRKFVLLNKEHKQ